MKLEVMEAVSASMRRARWDAMMSGVSLDDERFMDKVYVDMAPDHFDCGVVFMYSNLGRYGIQHIDSKYAKKIRGIESSTDADIVKLARAIEEDKHLHGWIRFNLLDNLVNRIAEMESES